MNKDEFNARLTDPVAQAARVQLCDELTSFFLQTGRELWVGSYLLREPEREGIALITQMTASVGGAAKEMLTQENYYAAAVLTRQLVELEYLAFLFNEASEQAEIWLRSDAAQLRAKFSPKQLRKNSQGKFRDSEYWTHCDLGGHPNPKGRILLPDHSSPVAYESYWADLAHHLSRLFQRIWPLIQRLGDVESARRHISDVEEQLRSWHERDALSEGVILEDATDT